jgi:hypothetical protein
VVMRWRHHGDPGAQRDLMTAPQPVGLQTGPSRGARNRPGWIVRADRARSDELGSVDGDDRSMTEAVRRLVEMSRKAQGLPAKIEEPAVLQSLIPLLGCGSVGEISDSCAS